MTNLTDPVTTAEAKVAGVEFTRCVLDGDVDTAYVMLQALDLDEARALILALAAQAAQVVRDATADEAEAHKVIELWRTATVRDLAAARDAEGGGDQ